MIIIMAEDAYFDKYEKRILQILIKERRALSVLEISTITGISRQKVGDTLNKLTEKDFAIEVIDDDKKNNP